MIKPNYKNGSIVNLMASIEKQFGGKPGYGELQLLPAGKLGKKNIILLVVDALGYNFFCKYGKDSFLFDSLKGNMTTVFPSTTAACVSTFMTGASPQQHGIMGWHMYVKEQGAIITTLRHSPRGGTPYDPEVLLPSMLLKAQPLAERLKVSSYLIQPREILNSSYTLFHTKKMHRSGYQTLEGMGRAVRKMIRSHHRRKYAYVYWPYLDSYGHKYGMESPESITHFREVLSEIEKLAKSLQDTTLIVTGDHGHVDRKKKFWVEDFKGLRECLILPLTGPDRCPYCFIRSGKEKAFLKIAKGPLRKYCTVKKSSDLIKEGYFGIGREHKKLRDRVGDYVLLMKEPYVLGDLLMTEEDKGHIGNHGGLSENEMLVPLIVWEC